MYLKEKQKLHSLSPLLQMLFDHYRKCWTELPLPGETDFMTQGYVLFIFYNMNYNGIKIISVHTTTP